MTNEIDVHGEEFNRALAELTGFIEESEKKKNPEPKKKIFKGFGEKEPVPRKEAAKEEEEEDQKETSEDTHDGENESEPEMAFNASGVDDDPDNKNNDEDNTDLNVDADISPFNEDDIMMGEGMPFSDADIGIEDETETDDADSVENNVGDSRDEKENESEWDKSDKESDDSKKKTSGGWFGKKDKKEIVKSDFGKNKVGTHVEPRPRYVAFEDLDVTISVECAKKAVEAMRALREVKDSIRPFLLAMIRDDGSRSLESFRTKEAALNAMHRAMDFYINEIEPKDYMKVVRVDDGENEHIYEPTPENEIDPVDGTIKRPSEINGTLHRIETENRGIVYFSDRNATARWDIYELADAAPGDPDDPLYEKYMQDMLEKARKAKEEESAKKEKKARRKPL